MAHGEGGPTELLDRGLWPEKAFHERVRTFTPTPNLQVGERG